MHSFLSKREGQKQFIFILKEQQDTFKVLTQDSVKSPAPCHNKSQGDLGIFPNTTLLHNINDIMLIKTGEQEKISMLEVYALLGLRDKPYEDSGASQFHKEFRGLMVRGVLSHSSK